MDKAGTQSCVILDVADVGRSYGETKADSADCSARDNIRVIVLICTYISKVADVEVSIRGSSNLEQSYRRLTKSLHRGTDRARKVGTLFHIRMFAQSTERISYLVC
jgi:hypothetical protein